jgi:hypothetical protein
MDDVDYVDAIGGNPIDDSPFIDEDFTKVFVVPLWHLASNLGKHRDIVDGSENLGNYRGRVGFGVFRYVSDISSS